MKNSAIVIRTGLGPAIGGTLFYVAAKYLPPMPYWDGFFRVLPAGLLLLAIRPGLPRRGDALRCRGSGGPVRPPRSR